jgi:hypothetical protein
VNAAFAAVVFGSVGIQLSSLGFGGAFDRKCGAHRNYRKSFSESALQLQFQAGHRNRKRRRLIVAPLQVAFRSGFRDRHPTGRRRWAAARS